MKQKVNNFLQSTFSIFVMIAVIGGAVAFILFVIAIGLGGTSGANLAVTVKTAILPYFFRAGSIAMLAGLVFFYVNRSHELSLATKSDFAATE